MLRYQKVGQDLAKEYSGDFDYEFAPSQANIPNQEELKKVLKKTLSVNIISIQNLVR